jgi:hypothetical protein
VIRSATSRARRIGSSTRPVKIAVSTIVAASSTSPTVTRMRDSSARVDSWKLSGKKK